MSRGWYGHYADYARRQPSYHERYNPVRDVIVGAGATIYDQVLAKPLRRFSSTFDKYMQHLPEIAEFVPEAERSRGQMSGHWNQWDSYSNWWHSPMWTGAADIAEVASHLYAPEIGRAFSIAREVLGGASSSPESGTGDFSFSGGGSLPSEPSSSGARLGRSGVLSRYGMSLKRRPIKKRAYGARTKQTRFGRYPASSLRSVDRSDGRLVLESNMNSRWEEIPKQVPSTLKYFDTVSGASPVYVSDNIYQIGSNFGWDPLAIAEYNVIPSGYASARGAGSSRRGPKICVLAIEIMVYIVNITPTIDTAVAADVSKLALLCDSSYKCEFYLDRQCNGAQFLPGDVFETIDTKTSNTPYPNTSFPLQTFPSVENDGRFERLAVVAHKFRLDRSMLAEGTATTLAFTPWYDVNLSTVLKGPFEISYAPRNNVSTGSGSIDQRKSLNINGIYFDDVSYSNLDSLSNPGSSQRPYFWIGSRTIFYDAD